MTRTHPAHAVRLWDGRIPAADTAPPADGAAWQDDVPGVRELSRARGSNPFYSLFEGIASSPTAEGGYTLAVPIIIAIVVYVDRAAHTLNPELIMKTRYHAASSMDDFIGVGERVP